MQHSMSDGRMLSRVCGLLAGVAAAAHVHFDFALLHRTRRFRATNRELDFGQALDATALGANEVRVIVIT